MLLKSKIIGQGPIPLIILHGFLGMSDNWKSYAKKMSSLGFQIHLLDQRNHGNSFRSNDFNYTLLVQDLHNYINHHNINNSSIIGHSMGGKTAMMFSSLYPMEIKKLIIVDILPISYKSNFQSILNSLKSIDLNSIKSRKEVNIILEKTITEVSIRRLLLKNLYRNNENKFDFKFNLDVLHSKFSEVENAINLTLKFSGKSLFVKGEKSNYITEGEMGKIKKFFPNSKLVTIPNSGHWVHSENPNSFFKKTLNFLKS
tara:strand:- start:103 stop:873 length:771 start_codon:yes stop_codon:yes gene_type:complete